MDIELRRATALRMAVETYNGTATPVQIARAAATFEEYLVAGIVSKPKDSTFTGEVQSCGSLTDVQLTMTREEAETLTDILARISGDPFKSRRKDADSIQNSLYREGIYSFSRRGHTNQVSPDDISGSINFKEPI